MMVYRDTEVRHGPPLDYVAEKVQAALMSAHFGCHFTQLLPEDTPLPPGWPEDASLRDTIYGSAQVAFSDGLKAFLALYDRLEAWSPDLVGVLLRLDHRDAEARIWGLVRGATVGGDHWPTTDTQGGAETSG